MNKKQYYSIGEFSEKTGVSIRTLHYYDEIGLLKPVKNPSSGHRLYTNKDELILQQIVSFKFLGYSLEEISEIINSPIFNVDLYESLKIQKKAFEDKREHIETVLKAINRTLNLLEEKEEIDSGFLMHLIRSIEWERDNRKWFEQHTSDEVVKVLFDHSKEVLVKGDKDFIRYTKGVKELVGRPVDDPEVQQLMGWWMTIANEAICSTFSLMNEEMVNELEGLGGEEEGEIPPSPFTEKEEEWLNRVMEYYFEYGAGATHEEEK
ncbi:MULTISPECIES: MerR family transcriptional regulator [Bacillus]|uniref:MerR family transcriptional regulator n=1 Tax=Bacillus TaxID=1386 RepID=UPI000BF68B48|nr:MerR family transcriptional regulator [Bacillus cereus]PFJ03021.1 MerR family transcriptional regulator [Bacillus cereus]PGO00579.1 MerR family transcriptional regulator [Bacillus cereus]PGU34858.1 MerR family transcriptional regulator [Bacillus cereus]